MRALCLSLACLFALTATALAASPSDLRGVGVDERLSDPPAFADVVARVPQRPAELRLFVRLVVERSQLQPAPGRFELERLSERVALYQRLGVRVLLDLGPVPAALAASEDWKALARAVATRCQGRVLAYEMAVERGVRESSFAAKLGAVELRAADPEALVVVRGLAGLGEPATAPPYGEELAPYVDALAVDAVAAPAAAEAERVSALGRQLQAVEPDARLVLRGVPLGDDPREAVRAFLSRELSQLAGPVVLTTYRAGTPALAAVVRAASSYADVLFGDVVALDDAAGEVSLSAARGPTTVVPHRLLYDTQRFATYFAYWSADGGEGRLHVALKEPGGRRPFVRDALTGARRPVDDFAFQPATNRMSWTAPLSPMPLLVDFDDGNGHRRATRVEVNQRALPSVGEIISRYQRVQAAQDAVLRSYVAQVHMEQHFRPSATDSGYDVVTENVLYADRGAVEWEETSFTLNGSKWGADRPPFPLLQPEKVLSLPLDLRLDADYEYRLEGTAAEEGRECYAVRFTPRRDDKPLYRGTVWIDSSTYERVKLQAVETRPGAPVKSSEEVHHFALEGAVGGRRIHLLRRLEVRQIILVAGRNILLERDVRFGGYRLNPDDFAQRRAASRHGDNVMYRDTDEGLRYLTKRGDERVVSERPTTSAKALAVGTVVDPSYDYPLPILGLNYLNFEFLGKNNQLAVLFGGVLALVNVQRPQLIGRHVDASLDLFAIAVSSRDKLYGPRGEVVRQQVQTLPFSTGFNLGWQFTPFQKLTGSYHLGYDHYSTSDQTASAFTVPSSTFTHGLGAAYEYRRGGYTLQANGAWSWRTSWHAWGEAGDFSPGQRDYTKYGVSLSKDFFAGVHKFRVNAAYFGGQNLDRFSMYQFGMFDETRIHGVPASGVRFPELAMLRASYSLNLLELYRLDVFADQALGRDPVDLASWRPITGLGVGFNLRGPWRTFVRGEAGKSFLPSIYAGAGSYNLQLTFYKPL